MKLALVSLVAGVAFAAHAVDTPQAATMSEAPSAAVPLPEPESSSLQTSSSSSCTDYECIESKNHASETATSNVISLGSSVTVTAPKTAVTATEGKVNTLSTFASSLVSGHAGVTSSLTSHITSLTTSPSISGYPMTNSSVLSSTSSFSSFASSSSSSVEAFSLETSTSAEHSTSASKTSSSSASGEGSTVYASGLLAILAFGFSLI